MRCAHGTIQTRHSYEVKKKKMYAYKIEQLERMLKAEVDEKTSGYGAHLKHWASSGKEINIDAGALEVLIDYYKNKKD